MNELTEIMMTDPQVGDRFTEHYCFWLYVVHRDGDLVVTMEASAPCTFPEDGKVRMYTLDEFRERFSYDSIPGYWIRATDRGNDVAGWYAPETMLFPYA